MRRLGFAACLVAAFGALALAETPADQQRVMSEACSLVGQQRNALADAVAVAEAQRKLLQERADQARERVEQWGAYFQAYVGEPKS